MAILFSGPGTAEEALGCRGLITLALESYRLRDYGIAVKEMPTWDAAANGMVTEALRYGSESSSRQWLCIQSTMPGFYRHPTILSGKGATYDFAACA